MPVAIAVVRPDPELAEAARALVGVERLDQELLAALRGGVDHPPVLEAQPHAGHLAPAVDRRERERDLAPDRVLDRPGEELAVGHVVVADARDQGAPGDVQRDVGARAR